MNGDIIYKYDNNNYAEHPWSCNTYILPPCILFVPILQLNTSNMQQAIGSQDLSIMQAQTSARTESLRRPGLPFRQDFTIAPLDPSLSGRTTRYSKCMKQSSNDHLRADSSIFDPLRLAFPASDTFEADLRLSVVELETQIKEFLLGSGHSDRSNESCHTEASS